MKYEEEIPSVDLQFGHHLHHCYHHRHHRYTSDHFHLYMKLKRYDFLAFELSEERDVHNYMKLKRWKCMTSHAMNQLDHYL
jgi:hypothetical protein